MSSNVSEVLALLAAERDERGMHNWEKQGSGTAGLRSYGKGAQPALKPPPPPPSEHVEPTTERVRRHLLWLDRRDPPPRFAGVTPVVAAEPGSGRGAA
jgi:hypothetical protein